jgi:hypothetical protein
MSELARRPREPRLLLRFVFPFLRISLFRLMMGVSLMGSAILADSTDTSGAGGDGGRRSFRFRSGRGAGTGSGSASASGSSAISTGGRALRPFLAGLGAAPLVFGASSAAASLDSRALLRVTTLVVVAAGGSSSGVTSMLGFRRDDLLAVVDFAGCSSGIASMTVAALFVARSFVAVWLFLDFLGASSTMVAGAAAPPSVFGLFDLRVNSKSSSRS